jgi:predicted nucleic acid-binding protein
MSLSTGSGPRPFYVAEPPAQYLARPPVGVDCSALVGILFEEPWQAQASQKIHGRTMNAPFLLEIEFTSVALKKHKQGYGSLVDHALARFEALDVTLHKIELREVLALSLQYKLSAYDASYLWLAAELKAPLATFDEKLAEAATTHLASLR